MERRRRPQLAAHQSKSMQEHVERADKENAKKEQSKWRVYTQKNKTNVIR